MRQYKRITKRQAKKLFFEGKDFYLLQCNLYIGNMWVTPAKIESLKYWEDYRVTYGKSPFENKWNNQEWHDNYLHNWESYTQQEKEIAWNHMYNNWQYYNANYEMGYYPHYYVEA